MINRAILFLALLVATFLSCTTSTPTKAQSGVGGVGVTISIVQPGKTSADFKGRDLNLIMDFEDTVVANLSSVINIHSFGAEIYPTNEIIKKSKVKRLTVPIYWKSYAGLIKDTADNSFYDSIYVTVYGDESFGESNLVTAKITNLPPAVTAYSVGDSAYSLPGHITDVLNYTYTISDSTDSIIDLALTIVDPDNNYTLTWNILSNDTDPSNSGPDSKLLSWSNSTSAKYIVRNSSYIQDVITALINDKDKQIDITLTVLKSDGTELLIDSLKFADTTYLGNDTGNIYKSITIDTVDVVAYAHKTGGVFTWSANSGTVTSSGTDNTVTYACISPIAMDTILVDTLIYLDTLTLVHANSIGTDSTVTKIIIVKRPLNNAPIFDSLKIDTITISLPEDTIINYLVEADSSISLTFFGSDADLGSVSYSWDNSKILGTLSAVVGSSITYIAPDTVASDTIIGVISDSLNFTDSIKIILTVANSPVLDSTLFDTTVSIGWPTVKSISSSDSVPIKVYASDSDIADLLTYRWEYHNQNSDTTSSAIDSIYYISADSNYVDTIHLTVTDKYGLSLVKSMLLNIVKP